MSTRPVNKGVTPLVEVFREHERVLGIAADRTVYGIPLFTGEFACRIITTRDRRPALVVQVA